ncbi:MAG TPA: ABC transporter permease [Acidobacteriaceae bacterium]|nr:ABC transporter permease [Acidobacteriaceae bacterium]
MSSSFQDLRTASRHLLKSPGFVVTSVLMLALTIGATTAIFSVVEAVLLRPLSFPQSDRLMVVSDVLSGVDMPTNGNVGVTPIDIRNYTRDTHSFSNLGGYERTGFELSGVGDPARVSATRMTSGVFAALAVRPLLGRFFSPQEDEQHEPVTVISYRTWRSRFHGDPGVLGTKLLLDRQPYVVVGVMPHDFEFPLVPGVLNRTELWIPMSFDLQELSVREASNWSYEMVGRLKPGITATQALADVTRVAAETVRNYPPSMAEFKMHPVVKALHEETVEQARPLVRTLFLAVMVVLLIACANLTGLLLVRAIRRRREVAVRLALGARAATILWQEILESLMLSVTGGMVGLLLAAVALRLGLRLLPDTLPRTAEIGLDWVVVGFALGLAIATGVVCGLAPAFAALRTSVDEALKEGGRTGTSDAFHTRLRSGLVVAEIAVSLVLLATSGLLLRSFEKMREVDLGFRPDHTLTAAYSLLQTQYATQATVDAFNSELQKRLQQQPGVKSVGLTSGLPVAGGKGTIGFVAEGFVTPRGSSFDTGTMILVEGDYFQTMGIPLVRGRWFTQADKPDGQLVVVVNRKLAEQSWPGQDPIGKRLRFGTASLKTPWATVVGEVTDVKDGSPDLPTKQQFYLPVKQAKEMAGEMGSPADLYGNRGYITLRSALPPEEMENVLRATVRSIDPLLPLNHVESMERIISDSETPRRFNTMFISSFAVMASLLAVLGIYGVIAFSVALRVHEMAIRMALGSQRLGIIRLVVMSGAKLAAAGCVIGLAGAFAALRSLRSFLFGVSAFDPWVLTFASSLLLLLALIASLLPACRAAFVDLTQALRSE